MKGNRDWCADRRALTSERNFFWQVLVTLVVIFCADAGYSADDDVDGFSVTNSVGIPTPSLRLSSMRSHGCVIDAEGVKCWGHNAYRQAPTLLKLNNPVQVCTGYKHSCALDSDGVKCWGSREEGQGGDRKLSDNLYQKTGLIHPTQISCGEHHTCAVDDEKIKCWGTDYFGEIRKKNERVAAGTPEKISLWTNEELPHARLVSAGWYHTCGIGEGGLNCWGDRRKTNLDARNIKEPFQISAGRSHTCVVETGEIYCWGSSEAQEAGALDVPARVKSPFRVSVGDSFTCAIDGNTVKCWGICAWESDLQCHDHTGLKDPFDLSVGHEHVCALDATGVVCWGKSDFGQTEGPHHFVRKDGA